MYSTASKGHILHPGRDSASAQIHLGSIEDLSKFTVPQTKALKMPMVDAIPLNTSSGDYFKCTLFLDLMEPKIPTVCSKSCLFDQTSLLYLFNSKFLRP